MFYKIKRVKPLEDFNLYVSFENNVSKIYDLKPLFDKWEVFNDLKSNNLYELVKVDAGGHGISWSKNIDLSCNELWDNGKTIEANEQNGDEIGGYENVFLNPMLVCEKNEEYK